MGSRRIETSNYRNPCLTMHQPWASLLVYGIKRIEGRSWPAPIRGRLWIHAAGKVPEPETIKAMEDFYREIYAMNGITDIKFPEHYPVSRLLGCVEIVGCVTCDEIVSWEALPASVRLEGLTSFCWLCEKPQKLIVPFEMRGFQGVYNLERKIYEGAVRGLSSVEPPQPVHFPLPDPHDRFSLKPGSLASPSNCSTLSEDDKSPALVAAIAAARAAATQFSKNTNSLEPPNRANIGDAREATTQFSQSNTNSRPPNRANVGGAREAATQFSQSDTNSGPPNRTNVGGAREAATQFSQSDTNSGPPNRANVGGATEAATQFSQSDSNSEPPIRAGIEHVSKPVSSRTRNNKQQAWVPVQRLGGTSKSS